MPSFTRLLTLGLEKQSSKGSVTHRGEGASGTLTQAGSSDEAEELSSVSLTSGAWPTTYMTTHTHASRQLVPYRRLRTTPSPISPKADARDRFNDKTGGREQISLTRAETKHRADPQVAFRETKPTRAGWARSH